MDWFKFRIMKWIDGRISLGDIAMQGLFLNLAIRAVSNEGRFRPGEFFCEKLHTSREAYDRALEGLLRLRVIGLSEDGTIDVPFVMELLAEYEDKRRRQADGGRKGMLSRWGAKKNISSDKLVITSVSTDNSEYLPITSDNRKDKNRIEDKSVINNTSSIGGSISRVRDGKDAASAADPSQDAFAANAYDTVNPDARPNQRPRNIQPPESADEVKAEGARQGMPWTTEMAEAFFGYNAARGWMTSGNVPMVDWRRALRPWFNSEYEWKGKRGAAKKFGRKQEYGDTI